MRLATSGQLLHITQQFDWESSASGDLQEWDLVSHTFGDNLLKPNKSETFSTIKVKPIITSQTRQLWAWVLQYMCQVISFKYLSNSFCSTNSRINLSTSITLTNFFISNILLRYRTYPQPALLQHPTQAQGNLSSGRVGFLSQTKTIYILHFISLFTL